MKDDSLYFKLEHNYRQETFITQSKVFYLGLPGEHFKLYLFIIHLIGDRNDSNPSIDQLTRFMGKSRRQIFRYLDDLKEMDLIRTITRYTDDNVRTSNGYLLRDISTMEALFTLDNLKQKDFKIDAIVKSRMERKEQKPINNNSDTGDTIENTDFFDQSEGHQCHPNDIYSDTSGTIANTNMSPVSMTPVAHRINTMVGMDGRLVEQTPLKDSNGEEEVAVTIEPLENIYADVLDKFGILNTDTGNEVSKIAIEENATREELENALNEFLLYRQRLSQNGEKVNNPFGFIVEKIRKYHKADDLLNSISMPDHIKEEISKRKKSKLNKPKAGDRRSSKVPEDKYKDFYLS